jgi:hypothetical protein
MGLFSFLKSQPIQHPRLGTLVRSRGYWKGSIEIPSNGSTTIVIAGDRSGPKKSAAQYASQVSDRYPSVIPVIEQALFEHYKPYQEAVKTGEYPEPPDTFPDIKNPKAVWPHVKLEYILIEPLSGTMTVEIVYTTSWDIEHALGARFHDNWKFLELCGSVLRVA